ncbi:MAG: BON domain-containing protein [Alphaproteobacteria bacterium]|nr:BON domain-containing protein [Alphaproteobacteria bacterium]MBT5540440.1 BON domain-containing protein [Alphaproteobacteria bacterium]
MSKKFSPLTIRLMTFFGLGSSLLFLSACEPVALVSTGATVVNTSAQERGFSGFVSDSDIRVQINYTWFKKNVDMYRQVNLSVQSGRVLLTGAVSNEEAKEDAMRLAWQADGVREVINELDVSDEQTIGESISDAWISTQIRSELIFTEDVSSSNYTVHTENGVVYLLGVALNPEELDKVIEAARTTSGVVKVVNYVRSLDDPIFKTKPNPPAFEERPVIKKGINKSLKRTSKAALRQVSLKRTKRGVKQNNAPSAPTNSRLPEVSATPLDPQARRV